MQFLASICHGVPREVVTKDRLPPVSRPQARPGRRTWMSSPAGFSTGIHSSISSAARRLRQENRSSCQPSVRLAVGPWKATKPHRCWIAKWRVVTSLNPIKGLG